MRIHYSLAEPAYLTALNFLTSVLYMYSRQQNRAVSVLAGGRKEVVGMLVNTYSTYPTLGIIKLVEIFNSIVRCNPTEK
jgi:hypothetical protein